MDRVLIYRSELLPYSETFIAAQAAALRSYEPLFVGTRRVTPSLTLPGQSRVVAEGAGELTRARRLAFRNLGWAPGLVRSLRAERPALLHAHFAVDAAEALPIARALRLPVVVTLHGYDVMAENALHRETARGRLYLARRQQLFAQADRFLCVSEAIRRKALTRGFPEQKLVTHAIGIDLTRFEPSPEPVREPVILFVGRLVEKKGCVYLVRAMRQVQAVIPAARLIVLGDGPLRSRLEAEARRLAANVTFAGVQSGEQVRAWMAASRVLAMPSVTAANGDAEGLPTVLGEALAVGLPVAAFRSSGIPELVRGGVEGLLADEGDEPALAANLVRLCQDDGLAARMGAAGRRRVEGCFEIGAQTRLLEDVYREVVAESRSAVHAPKRTSEQRRPAGSPASIQQGARIESLAAAGAVEERAPAAEMCGNEEPRQQAAQAEATRTVPDPPSSAPEAHRASHRDALEDARQTSAATTPTGAAPRLRSQAAWMISGNGIGVLFQAIYFVLIGRMLGSREYGAVVGVVALVNVLSQFSSLGMEMVLLRNISRDRASFAVTWGRALSVSSAGFLLLLAVSMLYARLFLPFELQLLVPWIAVSDGLLGKLAQLASRALQGADYAAWSARLTALTNGARALLAGLLLAVCMHAHRHASALTWVRVYWLASLTVAVAGIALVTRLLGRPRFTRVRPAHLGEGLSFSLSSSAISVYNDIDKTLLVSLGQGYAAGIYAAAYRVVDVLSTPIYSLFAAAAPRFFREGLRGIRAASSFSARMLRWTIPFGLAAAIALVLVAPALPFAFGRSFAGSVGVLRWLCLLPLIRGLHYAWGTTITAASSQWLRTLTQAAAALLNLCLNLALIPHWGWEGAALASLATDGTLAASNGLLVLWLLHRRGAPAQTRVQTSPGLLPRLP